MTMDLTDPSVLSPLLIHAFTDETTKGRVVALMEATEKHNAARLAAEAQAAVNAHMLDEAKAELQKAEAMMDEYRRLSDALREENAKVAALNNELNSEKARFDEMRQQAEEQMRLRETAAANADKDLRDREYSVASREGAVGSREDAAKVMADRAQKVIEWAKRGPEIE